MSLSTDSHLSHQRGEIPDSIGGPATIWRRRITLPLSQEQILELKKLRKELMKALVRLLAKRGHSNNTKQTAITQALAAGPDTFFSSYNNFALSLLPLSDQLYADVMDLLYARYTFSLSSSEQQFGYPLLQSLGCEALPHIRFLHFKISGRYEFTYDEEMATIKLDTWKELMEWTIDKLSYIRLHLMIDCDVKYRATGEAVIDVLKSLPQMKHFSIWMQPAQKRSWRNELETIGNDLTILTQKLKENKCVSTFHKFLSLPKELRLHILSFTALVPRGYADYGSSWFVGPFGLYDDGHCCGMCSNHYIRHGRCCCNTNYSSFSTTCICESFHAMLMVSQQFRTESLEVLFSNKLSFMFESDQPTIQSVIEFFERPIVLSYLPCIKDVAMFLHHGDFYTWRNNNERFETSMKNLLNSSIVRSGVSRKVIFDFCMLCFDGGGQEAWEPDAWLKIKGFESAMCRVLEQNDQADPKLREIYIDWSTLDLGSKPNDNGHQPGQQLLEQSIWLRNSPKYPPSPYDDDY